MNLNKILLMEQVKFNTFKSTLSALGKSNEDIEKILKSIREEYTSTAKSADQCMKDEIQKAIEGKR